MQQQHNNSLEQQLNCSQQQRKLKQAKNKSKKNKKTADKTLMRLQQPIYQLKKKDQGDAEYVIRKLMDRKQIKPKIGAIQRSPLFSQLAAILPAIKKANQQLKNRTILESEKLDAKLERVQDSSSSSQEDNEAQSQTKNQKHKKDKAQEQMIDQSQQGKQSPHTNEVQLNFLRYELSENLQSIQVKPKQQIEQKQQIKSKKPNKKIIEQL